MSPTRAKGELPALDALPPDAIWLHVGVHKTGTTALQASLAAARPSLRAQGVLYPGRDLSHNMAALAGMNRPWGWRQDGATRLSRRTWTRVATAARRHRGRVIISSEFLSEADPATITRLVADLGPDRVHVLITLRPLGRILPSSWQQGLKYGATRRYRPWLTKVLRRRRRGGRLRGGRVRTFWRRHDHAAVVERWASVVGPDRVTVAILEGLDRSVVYRLTEQRLALRTGTLAPAPEATNRSLTLPEARLLLAVNRAVRRRYELPTYSTRIRRGAALALVEGRTPPEGEPAIRTPRWARPRPPGSAGGRPVASAACAPPASSSSAVRACSAGRWRRWAESAALAAGCRWTRPLPRSWARPMRGSPGVHSPGEPPSGMWSAGPVALSPPRRGLRGHGCGRPERRPERPATPTARTARRRRTDR